MIICIGNALVDSLTQIEESKIDGIINNIEKILNLVDEMNKVNTDEVEPMSHPLNLKQFMRDDKITEILDKEFFHA